VTLRNTEFAYGIVVHVGNQTKIMMNSKKSGVKVTNLMSMINRMLYSVFILQFVINCSFTAMSMLWQRDMAKKATYLGISGKISVKKLIV
jgi:magnesium-transporting ATPase (P-type)